ncbi:hypothetical protein, partial [Vibrio harveyi]|uniref:hypothetical protein n=1 Tax=Vibrio harveyi TaxID=669 RepID=UPI001E3FB9A1
VSAHKLRIFRKIKFVIKAAYLKIKFINFVRYCDLDLVFLDWSIEACYGYDKNIPEDSQSLMPIP